MSDDDFELGKQIGQLAQGFRDLRSDVAILTTKVDDLKLFKAHLLGAAIVVSSLVSLLVTLIFP